MTFIVEHGSGAIGANSGVTVEFITDYLTSLGRQAENDWNTQDQATQRAAAVAATQYIESRWGSKFMGQKQYYFDEAKATGSVELLAEGLATDTLTLGNSEFSLSLGTDLTTAALVLSTLLEADNQVDTVQVTGTIITITLAFAGSSGNYVPLVASDATKAETTAFSGGVDGSYQATSFPRTCLFGKEGNLITGVPLAYRQAVAEYAVRSLSSSLFQDPSTNNSGRVVVETVEKVGPIEERVRFSEGAAINQLIKPYPAADKLLQSFLSGSTGKVIR